MSQYTIKPETLEPFSADELIYMYNKCLTVIPCEYCPLNDISFGDSVECRDHLFKFIGNYIQKLNTQNKTLKESLNEQALIDIKTFNEAICDLKLELTIAVDNEFKKKKTEFGTATPGAIQAAIEKVCDSYTFI